MNIIGHRGCAYLGENTLQAFELAVEQGVDMVELDAHAHSGEIIVIHNDTLDETTNGHGSIHKVSLDELRSYDAGNGQQIPLLSEVIELVDRQVPINIELKGHHMANVVGKYINRYLERGWREDDFVVSSFDHIQLARFKRNMPGIRTGALVYGIPHGYAAFADKLNTQSVNPSVEFINRTFVQSALQRGLEVHAYTANNEHTIRRMQRLGVTAIFTDFPDQAREFAA